MHEIFMTQWRLGHRSPLAGPMGSNGLCSSWSPSDIASMIRGAWNQSTCTYIFNFMFSIVIIVKNIVNPFLVREISKSHRCKINNIIYHFNRRSLKFCQRCGDLDRASNLKHQHFKNCQPYLKPHQRGFLRNGELPETNLEDFRMKLGITGMSEKSPKLKRELKESIKKEAACKTD